MACGQWSGAADEAGAVLVAAAAAAATAAARQHLWCKGLCYARGNSAHAHAPAAAPRPCGPCPPAPPPRGRSPAWPWSRPGGCEEGRACGPRAQEAAPPAPPPPPQEHRQQQRQQQAHAVAQQQRQQQRLLHPVPLPPHLQASAPLGQVRVTVDPVQAVHVHRVPGQHLAARGRPGK